MPSKSVLAPLKSTILAATWQIASRTPDYLRMSPSFIIIGAQRCGTTSLYNYLVAHPLILPARTKEIHFFDQNYEEGVAWYRCHFPITLRRDLVELARKHKPITGEASPYYLFHPLVPQRVSVLFPDVKLIVLLRNPVDRAYSHYHHGVRWGVESLPFERAIESEKRRLETKGDNGAKHESSFDFNHRRYSYLARGIYVDQLTTWVDLFSREQILVIQSEQFRQEPWRVLRQVLDFLGLPEWEPKKYNMYHQASYASMDPALRRHLAEFFRPHNERLYRFLGRDFGWDA